jgi:hypothetical protein
VTEALPTKHAPSFDSLEERAQLEHLDVLSRDESERHLAPGGVGRFVFLAPAELRRAADLGIEPWPGGRREALMRIKTEAISGRRIRQRCR